MIMAGPGSGRGVGIQAVRQVNLNPDSSLPLPPPGGVAAGRGGGQAGGLRPRLLPRGWAQAPGGGPCSRAQLQCGRGMGGPPQVRRRPHVCGGDRHCRGKETKRLATIPTTLLPPTPIHMRFLLLLLFKTRPVVTRDD